MGRRWRCPGRRQLSEKEDNNEEKNEEEDSEVNAYDKTIENLIRNQEMGYNSKIAGNNIIIDGQNYASNELDLPPTRILRSGAQEKWVPGGLAFRGEKSVFSNFFAKPFLVEGCKYLSVEQYFQYAKAIYFEETTLARKIIMTSNPFKIQNFGDRIKPSADEFDDWMEYAAELLHTGIYAKFTQNPSLRKDLLSTGDIMPFEATTDYYYGCGVNLTSKKWEDQSWEGDNLTGRALVEVRDRIKMEISEGKPCEDDASIATVTDYQSQVGSEDNEYRIHSRKARALPHSSTLCHSMVRKTRPVRKERPRPPADNQNVTNRSHARRSNFNDPKDSPPLNNDGRMDTTHTTDSGNNISEEEPSSSP